MVQRSIWSILILLGLAVAYVHSQRTLRYAGEAITHYQEQKQEAAATARFEDGVCVCVCVCERERERERVHLV